MIHKLMIEIDTETRDEANSIACDIEQFLTVRDIAEYATRIGLTGKTAFPHADQIKVRPVPTASVEGEEKLVAKARDEWEREGEVEFDDDPVVSRGEDNGAYVQAWVWVRDPDDDVVETGSFVFRESQQNGDHVDCKSCGKHLNDDTDEIVTNLDGFAFCSPKCLLEDHDEGETLHAFEGADKGGWEACATCGDTEEGLMHSNTERNVQPLLWEGE